MDIPDIEANLGKRFVIAVPGQRHFVAAVLRREREGQHLGERGWEIVYSIQDSQNNPISKIETVSTEQIMKLDEPYPPGEEEENWEDNEGPDGPTDDSSEGEPTGHLEKQIQMEDLEELAAALEVFTDPISPKYDPEFDEAIRRLRPDWFEPNEFRRGRGAANPRFTRIG